MGTRRETRRKASSGQDAARATRHAHQSCSMVIYYIVLSRFFLSPLAAEKCVKGEKKCKSPPVPAKGRPETPGDEGVGLLFADVVADAEEAGVRRKVVAYHQLPVPLVQPVRRRRGPEP